MRVVAIALIGIACGGSTTRPDPTATTTGRRRNSLYQEPRPPPPEPPPLADLLRCWAIDEPRDDVWPWICLGERDFAIDGVRGWNVWPHAGWQRDDTPTRAGWSTGVADGRTVWLTVVDGEPPAVHVSDGSGFAVRLVAAGATDRARVAAARAALPTVDEVCDAARACLAAIPPDPLPAPAIEIETEIEPEPEPPPLTGVVTLRDCDAAWVRAAEQVRTAFATAPPQCARPVDRVWWQDLERPYPPLDPR